MCSYTELLDYIRPLTRGGIALAFSGGVDSTLLLFALGDLFHEAPFPLVALTMHSPLQREAEREEALRMAEEAGVESVIVSLDTLAIPEVKNNAHERCYECKKAIFSAFRGIADKRGIQTLVDGTNADDGNVYRPGRKALREEGVISLLADLGLGKKEIRILLRSRAPKYAEKPSSPCLATRFAYGTVLTPGLLHRVEEGEKILRDSLPDATNLRLRVHGTLARIEISPLVFPRLIEKRKELSSALKQLGFSPITLDLEGFCSGSFDLT